MAEEKKTRSATQILLSRVENMRNDIALLRSRVDVSEKAVVEVKNYIKDQLTELYSQIEAAREMMDEIISFMEELKDDDDQKEHERDFVIEQGLDVEVPELTRPEEELLQGDDDGQSLTGDEDFLSDKDDDDMQLLHEEETVE